MPPKRKTAETSAESPPTKTQKTDPGIEAMEQTEAHLKSLNGSFSELKANFDRVIANESSKATELGKELTAKEERIEGLNVKLDRLQEKHNLKMRELRESIKKKVEARIEAEKLEGRLKEVEGEKQVMLSYCSSLQEAKRDLGRKVTKIEHSQKPRQNVMDAAAEVKDLIAGLPVQSMGPLGEALSKLDTAFKDLSQAETAAREQD